MHFHSSRLFSFRQILVATTAFAAVAFANGAETDDPAKAFETAIREVVDVLHEDDNLSVEAKREKIMGMLQGSFSFDVIIRRALGRNWDRLDAKQQEAVTDLVSDMLIRAYTRELKNGAKPEMTFSEAQELTSTKIEVPSQVTVNGRTVNIAYRLGNIRDRGWQVYDVLIEGISMVGNYRKQFDDHFLRKSAADLIDVLKDKLENLGE